MMEAKTQTSQSAEVTYKKEVRVQKLLNIIGIFILGGLALTNLINPLPSSDYRKEILFFIGGSALIYYITVNIFFLGNLGRKVVFIILILLSCFSLFMTVYLEVNSMPH